MNFAQMYAGCSIKSDPCIPEFKESHRQERKWAHRLMWRRYQRFTVSMSRVVVVIGGVMYAHPNTVELLKDSLVPFSGGQS